MSERLLLTLEHLLYPVELGRRDDGAGEQGVVAPLALPAPPPGELDALLDLLIVGDLRALQRRATSLAQEQPELTPFARHVYRLTDQFELDALRKLLSTPQPGAQSKERR